MSYNQTMGYEARKGHHYSQRVTKQTMGNEARRLIVHTRSYQCNQWAMKQEKKDSLFTQGVTMQTMGNEARKTHFSHNELQM
ncbi:hypothetical protein KSS87_012889 [Heliosperma pusillum]|nr:hypothetical protein KSS87_012889 [Heliosperma pusillum]